MGLRNIDIAEYINRVGTTSAGATSLTPIMGTNKGSSVIISAVVANLNGTIIAYGY
jgi:hypothetical protein